MLCFRASKMLSSLYLIPKNPKEKKTRNPKDCRIWTFCSGWVVQIEIFFFFRSVCCISCLAAQQSESSHGKHLWLWLANRSNLFLINNINLKEIIYVLQCHGAPKCDRSKDNSFATQSHLKHTNWQNKIMCVFSLPMNSLEMTKSNLFQFLWSTSQKLQAKTHSSGEAVNRGLKGFKRVSFCNNWSRKTAARESGKEIQNLKGLLLHTFNSTSNNIFRVSKVHVQHMKPALWLPAKL